MNKTRQFNLYAKLQDDINWYKARLGLDKWTVVISPRRPCAKRDARRHELGITVFDSDEKEAIIWINISAHNSDKKEKLEKTLAHEMLHVLINGECRVRLDDKAEKAICGMESMLYEMYMISRLIRTIANETGIRLGKSR